MINSTDINDELMLTSDATTVAKAKRDVKISVNNEVTDTVILSNTLYVLSLRTNLISITNPLMAETKWFSLKITLKYRIPSELLDYLPIECKIFSTYKLTNSRVRISNRPASTFGTVASDISTSRIRRERSKMKSWKVPNTNGRITINHARSALKEKWSVCLFHKEKATHVNCWI